ncbi:WecB/TagA/CpsF family glycosyltransferase, partial [uncultured Polaribacter sp.]|uniref:WecB/TagA/CpsF family glycosyltransferase n=1 Tax=uncultured Polaribacter sp. TaxID=174711 RepID=UPI0026075734
EDNKMMVAAVNTVKPDVLFVGMTAPKQEKWSKDNAHQLDTKTICAIGAVFDFYAGTVKRPSQFWIDLKLEWFIRLVKEPKRMWRRYLYYGPFFSVFVIKSNVKKRKVVNYQIMEFFFNLKFYVC